MSMTIGTKDTVAAYPAVAAAVNKQLANWTVLFLKLHNYHWFVKGNQFFTLHAKFEELYNEAAQYIDALAERILTIGGKPIATMRECLTEATVKESSGTETASEMVRTLVQDFRTIGHELREALKTAQNAGDESTHDLLLSICTSLEKHVWMLASFSE